MVPVWLLYPVIILGICFATVFINLAQKRHKAALAVPEPEPEPQPEPEPRVPCDLDRPYPRPKGGRRRQDSACPVCGTGDTTGSLDGRVLGWRAHASCAEWLGDWKPLSPEIAELQRALDALPAGGSWPLHIPAPKPASPRSDNCCDGCGVPLGTGVRVHDAAGHHYCPSCDREQRRRKEGAYAATPPKRRKAGYPVIDITTVLTVDGFHEGGYQVAQRTVSYEESADLPGSPQVRVEPECAAATLLRPEPVMYGWSVWIRAATPEEAHKTLAALEDMARSGGGLPVGEWRADLERLISAVEPLSPGLLSLPG